MKRKYKSSVWRDAAEIAVFFAVCALVIWLFLTAVRIVVGYFRADGGSASLEADTVNEGDGVGRVTASLDGVLLLGGGTDELEGKTALRVYTEGVDSPLPEWWDPDGAILMWEDHSDEVGKMVDMGCPDYNVESTLWGWDGHMMTESELDLFSRVFMLEFWGTSEACCEAGCDAILNLWDSGLYGRTMGECLWAKNDSGKYIYSVCNYLWNWNYDPDGLEWCREFCRERFLNGPEWECMYFQLYGFHDPEWAVPLYELDGVYFSAGR